ncbi:hypothetical protein FPRO04_14179 [Fusarium proliferatum]|nr:hypothetical protein FPRO04_14179 [Fusarium proliferatum]
MSTQVSSEYRLHRQNITPSQVQTLRRLELHYDISFQAIICIPCGFALKTDDDRVGRHLKEKHGISKKRRQKLNTLVNSLHLPDLDELPKRVDGFAQHPYLALQTGAECKHCALRSTSYDMLSRHLKKEHSQEINSIGTRGKRWLRHHIRDNLTFQSWKANDIQRSWIVTITDNQQSLQKGADRFLQPVPDAINEFAQKLVMEERGRLDDQQYSPSFNGTLGKKELLTNWMRRTSWDETLSQARRDMLLTLSEVPLTTGQPFWIGIHDGEQIRSSVKDEYKLAIIVQALDRLLDRCADTVMHTDVSVRRWLRGRFPDRPYKAPFELVMRSASESQYRKEFKRCLCFWLRVLQLPKSVVPSIIGRGLSESQREMLEQLWSDPVWKDQPPTGLFRVEDDEEGRVEETSEEEEDSEDEDKSYYEDRGDTEDDEEKTYAWPEQESGCSDEESTTGDQSSTLLTHQDTGADDPCSDVVLELCYSMATEDFEDGTASSSLLVYFSAVRGLSRPTGDEFLRPHQFTPVLSRLIYCTRLIFLEMTLPRFPHRYAGIPARPSHGHLRRLMPVRTEKMCDGTMSPLGEFLSLLSYGRALSRSEGPVYHFYWSEDDQVLSWDGCLHLSMASFRGLAREALRQATIQCQRLMYDWEPADPDLSGLRDRLSTAKSGYSFVSDPANGLNDAYLELFMRACTSSIDGILKSRGQFQSLWNAEAAQTYLDAHDASLKTLMVLCYLDGGQAARISELLTIEYCNTSSRLRGIGIYGTSLFSITRHQKARLTTNNEFQVARFFSPPVARLVYRYLVYVRPVAYTILRKCFHHESTNTLLFAPISRYSRNSFWSAKTFSGELKRISRTVPGIPCEIGVQLYRQLSIAITEKHVRTATSGFNRFDDTTCAASGDAAFAWQSGHRPMQRYSTYGLDGAFPDQLQPALLRIYARISADWHKFLSIDDGEELRSANTTDDTYQVRPSKEVAPLKRSHDKVSSYILSSELPEKRQCRRLGQLEGRSSRPTDVTNVLEETISCGSVESRMPAEHAESPTDRPILTAGPFIYLEQLRLVVCNVCRHLKQKHTKIAADQIGEIIKAVDAIPGLVRKQNELHDFQFPDASNEAFPYLEPPRGGMLGCPTCGYFVSNRRDIQAHYREKHGWENDWKKGGNIKKKLEQPRETPWTDGVYCQRFFRRRWASRWFQVRKDDEPEVQIAINHEPREDAVKRLIRIHQEQVAKFNAAEEDEINVADEKKEPSAWLERTGWVDYLQKFKAKKDLLPLAAPVQEDEPVLQVMCDIFDGLADHAKAAAVPSIVGLAALYQIERKEIHIKPSKPFDNRLEDKL